VIHLPTGSEWIPAFAGMTAVLLTRTILPRVPFGAPSQSPEPGRSAWPSGDSGRSSEARVSALQTRDIDHEATAHVAAGLAFAGSVELRDGDRLDIRSHAGADRGMARPGTHPS